MKKKSYTVEGMHCASCAMMIESDLEDIGVQATCSYAKQTLEVEFDPNKTKEESIVKTVADAGYKITL